MKTRCSVPILTLNALEGLKRLLPLLIDRFDDVYIVDGQSTDGTREYAQSLGVRIERQFENDLPNQRITDFSAMRHRSWALAQHPWVLWLDADEVPSPALLDRVQDIVTHGGANEAHRFVRVPQLPDGRIVTHGFYFPERIIRLFNRDSGIHLVDRPVHEKFVLPDGVRAVDHDEQIIAPWTSASDMWRRQRRYLDLDNESTIPTWPHLVRWIWLYNFQSLLGQFLRMCRSNITAIVMGGVPLPWSYNLAFLKYRMYRITLGTADWMRKRYRALSNSGGSR